MAGEFIFTDLINTQSKLTEEVSCVYEQVILFIAGKRLTLYFIAYFYSPLPYSFITKVSNTKSRNMKRTL
jgi:hypothetical protein